MIKVFLPQTGSMWTDNMLQPLFTKSVVNMIRSNMPNATCGVFYGSVLTTAPMSGWILSLCLNLRDDFLCFHASMISCCLSCIHLQSKWFIKSELFMFLPMLNLISFPQDWSSSSTSTKSAQQSSWIKTKVPFTHPFLSHVPHQAPSDVPPGVLTKLHRIWADSCMSR